MNIEHRHRVYAYDFHQYFVSFNWVDVIWELVSNLDFVYYFGLDFLLIFFLLAF